MPGLAKHWNSEPNLTVLWCFSPFCICLLFSFVNFFCCGLLSFSLTGVCSILYSNINQKIKNLFSYFIASTHFWVRWPVSLWRAMCYKRVSCLWAKVSSSNEILGFNISCFKLLRTPLHIYVYVCVCVNIYIVYFVAIPHAIWEPYQGSTPCPLQWKHGFLTFVPPWKSHHLYFWLFSGGLKLQIDWF